MIPLNQMWGTRNDCFMQCICKYEIIPAILWSPPPSIQPRDHHGDVTKWCCCTTSNTDFAHMKHGGVKILVAQPMDAHQASQQEPLASDLTIYGHSVEQRESSPHTMHNMKNHAFFWVSLLSLPFFKYLYPEAGLLSQLVQGQLIKREKSSVRLSSCTAKSSVHCFNITNDKLGATDLHCLHNDWIFTTNFIRWVMTDSTL